MVKKFHRTARNSVKSLLKWCFQLLYHAMNLRMTDSVFSSAFTEVETENLRFFEQNLANGGGCTSLRHILRSNSRRPREGREPDQPPRRDSSPFLPRFFPVFRRIHRQFWARILLKLSPLFGSSNILRLSSLPKKTKKYEKNVRMVLDCMFQQAIHY